MIGWKSVRPWIIARLPVTTTIRISSKPCVTTLPARRTIRIAKQAITWINESLDYNVVADAMLEDYYGLDKWFKPEVNPEVEYQAYSGFELPAGCRV